MATFTAGQVLTAAQLNAIFDPLSNAWTAYTPTLTNATIGNGTISGRWMQAGKTVFVEALFILGSTSTVGTHPRVSLPANVNASIPACLPGAAYDTSADTLYALVAQSATSVAAARLAAGSGEVTATIPFTWAVGDQINFGGSYEAL